MTVKAVFASLGFSIYITKEHLELLIQQRVIHGPVYLGKEKVVEDGVMIQLTDQAKQHLSAAYAYERDIVDKAKEQIASGYLGRKRKEGH